MLLLRVERQVELVAADDETGERYGTPLCAEHLSSSKPPLEWSLIDRRTPAVAPDAAVRPRRHGAPGTSTNPGPAWEPRRELEEIPESLSSVRSPLLRRAFLEQKLILRYFTRFLMELQVNLVPQSLL